MNLSGSRVRPSPFLQDIVLTSITTAATILSLVLMTRWLARGLGPESFGAYVLSRRLVTAVTAFSPVGLSLTRCLASGRGSARRDAYLVAAVAMVAAPMAVLVLVGFLRDDLWTIRLFRDLRYRSLWDATLLLGVGTVLYTVLYGWYRGTGSIRVANVWQLVAIGVGPMLVAAIFARTGRPDLIVLVNALLVGAAVAPLCVRVAVAARGREVRQQLRARLTELLRYGGPRVPGNVAFAGLFAVGPLLAPHFGGLRDAGYLVAGQSILRVVEGATAAFGLVALARLTELHSERRTEYIKVGVQDLLALALHLGLFATCHLLLWSDLLVVAWLGPGYAEGLPLIRVTVLAAIPYLAYTLLNSVIDAVNERAINSPNLIIALVVTLSLALALGAAGHGAWGLSIAGTIGFFVLGGLTVRSIFRTFACEVPNFNLAATVLINLGLLVSVGTVKWFLGQRTSPAGVLLVGAGLEILALGVYVLLLRRLGVRWVRQIELRIFAPSMG